VAATPTDPNPVVMRIVRLLASASMADDRIALTNRASPQDDFGAARGPIRFKLVRRDRKWDKQNRSSWELCPPALTRQDLGRKRSSFLLRRKKSNWKRVQLLGYRFLTVDSQNWPLINGLPDIRLPGRQISALCVKQDFESKAAWLVIHRLESSESTGRLHICCGNRLDRPFLLPFASALRSLACWLKASPAGHLEAALARGGRSSVIRWSNRCD
jgi:hypothetical protein